MSVFFGFCVMLVCCFVEVDGGESGVGLPRGFWGRRREGGVGGGMGGVGGQGGGEEGESVGRGPVAVVEEGPAGGGKGTVSGALAHRFGLAHALGQLRYRIGPLR